MTSDTFVMYFSCENCREERGLPRGHFLELEEWARGHGGHDVHVNLLGLQGVSVAKFLEIERKRISDYERNQKVIKVLTFGLRGETAADRRRKGKERANLYRKIWDSQNTRASREEDEA